MPRATLLKPIVLGTSTSRPRGHCALDGQYIWLAPIKAEPSPIVYCMIKARISYVFQGDRNQANILWQTEGTEGPDACLPLGIR